MWALLNIQTLQVKVLPKIVAQQINQLFGSV